MATYFFLLLPFRVFGPYLGSFVLVLGLMFKPRKQEIEEDEFLVEEEVPAVGNTRLQLPEDIFLIILEYCDEESILNTRDFQSLWVRRFTETTNFLQAVKSQNLQNMMWIKKRNANIFMGINLKICAYTAKQGNLNILKWLKKNGCPWDEDTFESAACNGDMETLEWLKKNKCPWDAETFVVAARSGKIEILEWLKRNKCPWNAITFPAAAARYNLRVLWWLKVNECPWDKNTFYSTLASELFWKWSA